MNTKKDIVEYISSKKIYFSVYQGFEHMKTDDIKDHANGIDEFEEDFGSTIGTIDIDKFVLNNPSPFADNIISFKFLRILTCYTRRIILVDVKDRNAKIYAISQKLPYEEMTELSKMIANINESRHHSYKKNDRRALYESIMSNIAPLVKSMLNENVAVE